MSELDGSAEFDLGRVALTLEAPRGALSVNHRHGDTTVHIGAEGAVSGEVRSVSGRVELRVPPDVRIPGVSATTAYGEVRWSGSLDDWGLRSGNSPRTIWLQSAEARDPGLRLHSDAGAVVLERASGKGAVGREGPGAPRS